MKGIVLTPHTHNPYFKDCLGKGKQPDAVSYRVISRGLCNGGRPICEAVDFLVEPEILLCLMLRMNFFSRYITGGDTR